MATKVPSTIWGLIILVIVLRAKKFLRGFLFYYSFFKAAKQGKEPLRQWVWNLDKAEDIHANVLGKYLWDDLYLKPDSKVKFGNPKETMSSVIGKCDLYHSLSERGEDLRDNLNKIEKDHTKLAIDWLV